MPYFSKEIRKKLCEQKFFSAINKTKNADESLHEEILKTANANKSFSIGAKVRIIKGEQQGKIGLINYCNDGKCVVKLGSDQLFLNINDLDFASEKPLDEMTESVLNEEDDVTVTVDGKVVADTAADESNNVEKVDSEAVAETSIDEFGPKLGITDLLLDAVNDENEAIQKYNSLIAACIESGFEDIANVVKHINEEENIHVGMLQYAMGTLSEQAKTIETGTEEAEEIMSGNLDAEHEDAVVENN